jgi:hypothetical protein
MVNKDIRKTLACKSFLSIKAVRLYMEKRGSFKIVDKIKKDLVFLSKLSLALEISKMFIYFF